MNLMIKRPLLSAVLLASGMAIQPARAQQPSPASTTSTGTFSHRVETSISLGTTAQLTATRITETKTDLITQSLSPSAGVLATFRQSFSPWLGYSVNLGYTRATYRYTESPSAPNAGSTSEAYTPNHIYETSVSYIARKELTGRFSVFGEAGAGAVGFAAIETDLRSSPPNFYLTFRKNTFRPEAITGFGLEYRLAHGLGIRAEYRGLIAKYPDYASGIVKPTTVSSQPALSLTYSFGTRSGAAGK